MKTHLHFLWVVLLFIQCSDHQKHITKTQESNGYTYETVTNDPTNTRVYTLDNGLKVYLSKYDDAPRIHVFTAIKAGGKNDPADNTGLAHYLEHMMFKGTDEFGTKDYASEKVYLDSIEQLYNDYAQLINPTKRAEMYAQIDAVSNKAASFAIPNEYDKIISLLGGKRLNAYTTNDRTVYTVDIPSNELERFLTLEGKRFKKIVNRLFHTELEAVYEEKNRSLDNDYWKVYEALYATIFPNHPYGKQTVIGTIDHLKNPSITAIKAYFDTYYRPNNAAICMSGDLDYDATIALIDKHFGNWEPNAALPQWKKIQEPPLESPQNIDVLGPQEERVSIGYRFPGTSSEEYKKVVLIDMLLNNSTAGLIDLNLMQQQKVLRAGSYVDDLNDYSVHTFYGTPKAGQELSDVQQLILAQIDSIKAGAFEPWLLKAVVNDLKKSEMEKDDSEYANHYRANEMVMAFTNDIPWVEKVRYFNELSNITKEELVTFANANYNDNYVVVNKRNGTDPKGKKVDKPAITKVPLNRNATSAVQETIATMEIGKLQPKYLDFERDLQHYSLGDLNIIHKENNDNDLFELNYIFDFANNASPKIGLALTGLLDHVGTNSLSAEEIKKEFYKLGSSFSARSSSINDRLILTLNGLNEHFEATLSLFEMLLKEANCSEEDLKKLIDRLKKKREDNLKNKSFILWSGLFGKAKYGATNPSNFVLSNEELDKLTVEDLTPIIKNISNYPHRVTYYGNLSPERLRKHIEHYHPITATKEAPAVTSLSEQSHSGPTVYWSHYDMVQTEMILLAKSTLYDSSKAAAIGLFNAYFGGGMNSIVFQEIREAQGLAYSVFSRYGEPKKKGLSNFMYSYVGIQADKQKEALSSMFNLIRDLPQSENAFAIAKASILNQLESERITKSKVIDAFLDAEDHGLTHDNRKNIYEEVQKMSMQDLMQFHKEYISSLDHTIVLIGNRNHIDFENLREYGKVVEVDINALFPY